MGAPSPALRLPGKISNKHLTNVELTRGRRLTPASEGNVGASRGDVDAGVLNALVLEIEQVGTAEGEWGGYMYEKHYRGRQSLEGRRGHGSKKMSLLRIHLHIHVSCLQCAKV